MAEDVVFGAVMLERRPSNDTMPCPVGVLDGYRCLYRTLEALALVRRVGSAPARRRTGAPPKACAIPAPGDSEMSWRQIYVREVGDSGGRSRTMHRLLPSIDRRDGKGPAVAILDRLDALDRRFPRLVSAARRKPGSRAGALLASLFLVVVVTDTVFQLSRTGNVQYVVWKLVGLAVLVALLAVARVFMKRR